MMKDSTVPADRTVTVGEIAEFAGVGPSAVSNWRNRRSDFPLPVESGTGGDLFDLQAVLQWLERHGKAHTAPTFSVESLLWSLGDVFRGGADLEQVTLLLMQLVFLRSQLDQAEAEARREVREFWSAAREGAPLTSAWKRAVDALSRRRPELQRVLQLPAEVREDDLRLAVARLVDAPSAHADWGSVATSMLRRYQDAAGPRGAFLATPESVTDLAIALLEPIRGTVYDPAAGLGMVLARAWKNRATDEVRIIGQEVNEFNWRLGYLHLAIAGASFEIATGDTLRDDRFRGLRAERILVDAPIGQKVDANDAWQDDRWRYGIPRSSSEWLWAQQLLNHLADDGVGVMITSTGSLVRGGLESAVRRQIVQADLLDAVVELPPGLLPGTSSPLALLVFDGQRRGRQGHILFVDGRQLGTPRRGKPRELSVAEVRRVANVVASWRSGTFTAESLFSATAPLERIAELKFELSPTRYVGYQAQSITEIDGEPIEDRVERLRRSLRPAAGIVIQSAESVEQGANAFSRISGQPWPTVRLGDLLSEPPRTGMRQELEKKGPDVPYVMTRAVSAGPGFLDAVPDDLTRGDVRDRLATKGDLLLVSRGIDPAGMIRCASIRFDGVAAYSESLMRLRLDGSRVEPDFVRLYLTSRHGRATLAAVTTGSVIANLRAEALLEVKVPLPPLAEQHAIVVATRRMEHGIVELTNVRLNADELLDALREGIAAGLYAPLTVER